jgi:c(7)-type cytochrome triheme protein
MRNITQGKRPLLWILALAALVVVVAAGYFFFAPKTRAAPQQPIPFNHQVMVQLGIDCQFCHTDARRSISAGMPSVEKCMGCHQFVATNTPAIQQLTAYWQRQAPIQWVRVNQLPRFVYFSHEVHVTVAGLDCAQCHGDVAHMAEARPVVTMDMGWCLKCHEKQPNAPQLKDCLICHQ